jgi:hypothetical protein
MWFFGFQFVASLACRLTRSSLSMKLMLFGFCADLRKVLRADVLTLDLLACSDLWERLAWFLALLISLFPFFM